MTSADLLSLWILGGMLVAVSVRLSSPIGIGRRRP